MQKTYNINCMYLDADLFRIVPLEANTTIKWSDGTDTGTPNIQLLYSYDLNNWNEYTIGTSLVTSNTVYWRGQGVFSSLYRNNTLKTIQLVLDKLCDLEGCISSLFYNKVSSHNSLPSGARLGYGDNSANKWALVFERNTYIHSIKNLKIDLAPAWTSHGYGQMFQQCTNLIDTPIFDFNTSYENGNECYHMFYKCTSLVNAYSVPNIMTNYCFYKMFEGCTSLITAPALPATTVSEGAYYGMFMECSSLQYPPSLPALTVGKWGYAYMLFNCTSLLAVPALPATSIVYNIENSSSPSGHKFSYTDMFYNSELITTPETYVALLPAGTASAEYRTEPIWTSNATPPATGETYGNMFRYHSSNSYFWNGNGIPIIRDKYGNTVRYLTIKQ